MLGDVEFAFELPKLQVQESAINTTRDLWYRYSVLVSANTKNNFIICNKNVKSSIHILVKVQILIQNDTSLLLDY